MSSFVEISSFSRSKVEKLTKNFSCIQHPSLYEYIRQYAYKHSKDGLYRTYLLEVDGMYCVYISISLATVQNEDNSFTKIKDLAKLQQNLSYAVPALKVTRLCVFDQMQGKGIGSIMMTFATILSIQTQVKIGCKIEIVDAKKVVTPHELNSFEEDKRLSYLQYIKEFCTVFNLTDEYRVIEKYYG